MKRTIVLLLALAFVLSAGVPAISGPIWTKTGTATGATVGWAIAPVSDQEHGVIHSVSLLASIASVDFKVYIPDDSKTLYASATAEPLGTTLITVDSCVGFDDSDIVTIMWQGGTIEADTMVSCVETTGVMTLTAGLKNAVTSTQAAANRIEIFEMKELVSMTDIGTSRILLDGIVIYADTKGPVAAWANTSGGTANIEWFTVEGR